jgi:hypothetical protein
VSIPLKTHATVIHLYVSIIREFQCSLRAIAPRKRRKEGTRVTAEGVDAGREEEERKRTE